MFCYKAVFYVIMHNSLDAIIINDNICKLFPNQMSLSMLKCTSRNEAELGVSFISCSMVKMHSL